jgi:Family of unknown function (DUF5715)
LSALSLMHRAALMAAALALATTASAQVAHATYSAKTQRRLAATTRRHVPAGPVHSESYSGTHSERYSGGAASISAGRRTPDEVGRSAGLAIREQLARRQTGRGLATVRAERSRYYRRVRLERTALRPETRSATRSDEFSEAAEDNPVPDATTAETDEAVTDSDRDTDRMESRRTDGAREPSATELRERQESADVETAPTGRARRNETAGANADDATDGDTALQGEATGDTIYRADSASTRTNDDVASLSMPRGGMPAPLRGSLASLERQNDRSDAEGLERIQDEADLAARIADKLLVPLPASIALTVNPDLEENHRYCRPWTAKFLADLARAHEAAFHRSIEVSSAVRTVEYQKRLMETNGNAAPAEGDLVSPHLTGATVDIAKKGLNRAEIAWMRRQLADLQTAGKIDVEEEFKQSCFHITVYKSYVSARKAGESAPAKAVALGATPMTLDQIDEARGE